MEIMEISPFIFVPTTSSNLQTEIISDVTLDNFHILYPQPSSFLTALIQQVIQMDPSLQSSSFMPLSYLTSKEHLSNYSTSQLISACLDIPFLSPLYTNNGLIFKFYVQKSPRTTPVKLAELFEEEMGYVVGEVIDFVRNSSGKKKKNDRIGEDLYVKRKDGFEKVYKNNSDYYMQKVQERQIHYKRCERLKTQSDNYYTPISRKTKVNEYFKFSAKSQNSDERKISSDKSAKSEGKTPQDSTPSPVQNLSKKFSNIILQEITNIPLGTQKIGRRLIN
ncbi:unnamed protein product [Blepharisma stoltei]|uniref:Uncharacterized protein n=1 Tax=Blepharisma stoltei TaxID=1481888 RepID=A0AAU9JYB2_9CILI|nr:unnamed protein product [Blepharisma stoltei]